MKAKAKTRSVYNNTLSGITGKCLYCGQPASTVDHYVPLILGGLHVKSNLVPACNQCNSEKSDIHGDIFIRFIRRFGVPPRGWNYNTNKSKMGVIFAILKFNKKNYENPKEYADNKFGTNLVNRVLNTMDVAPFNHNNIKSQRMNNGCEFCGGQENLEYSRKMFICTPCAKFSEANAITYDILHRYGRRFGTPKIVHNYSYRRNVGKLFQLQFIWKHNTPIKFYKIVMEKRWSKHLVRRFIRAKKYRNKNGDIKNGNKISNCAET